MARKSINSNLKDIYTKNGYFIGIQRIKLELEKGNTGSIISIAKMCGVNYTSLCQRLVGKEYVDNNKVIKFDYTKIYKDPNNKDAGFYEYDPKIIEIARELIEAGKQDEEIKNIIAKNLQIILRKDGLKMNNNNEVVKTNRAEGVQNISIDLGNFSIKCCGEKETIITSKVKTVYDGVCDNEYIKFADSETYDLVGCEDGKYQLDPQKTKKNYISQVIYSIINSYNEAPDDIQCNVALLLPITQMNDKDEYIEKLKGYECIVEVTGEKVHTVKINDVEVLPESVASYFTLSEEEKKNKLAIVDIGSKNVNICSYLHGRLQKVECLEYGTFKYLEALAKKYNANGNVDITAHNITTQIECGLVEHDNTLITNFAKTVMADIVTKMDAFKLYNRVLFGGGGSILIEDFIEQIPNVIKSKDLVMANVAGAKNMMDEIYSA